MTPQILTRARGPDMLPMTNAANSVSLDRQRPLMRAIFEPLRRQERQVQEAGHSQERLAARTSITKRSTKSTKAHQEWAGMSEWPNEIGLLLTLRGLGIKSAKPWKPESVAQDPEPRFFFVHLRVLRGSISDRRPDRVVGAVLLRALGVFAVQFCSHVIP